MDTFQQSTVLSISTMEASQEGSATIARSRALPLNMRRLTKALFQALAQGLELSSTAGSMRVEAHN